MATTVAPNSTPVTPAAAPAPVAAVAPVAAPAVAPVVAAVKNHNQSGFPETRLRNYLDKLYVNVEVTKRLNGLHEQYAPFQRADKALKDGKEEQFDAAGKPVLNENREVSYVALTDARRAALTTMLETNKARRAELEREMNALSHARIRFSDESGRVVRDVVYSMTRELLKHAFESCKLVDKKIIHVSHLHSAGVEKLNCFPLICNLNLWRNPPSPPKKSTAEAETEAAATPESEAAAARGASPSFVYYLSAICSELTHPTKYDAQGNVVTKTVTKKSEAGVVTTSTVVDKVMDGPYAALRTSTQIKDYLSDLIFEFFARISPLIQLQLNALKIKTIGSDVIMSVIQRIMVDGQQTTESLVYETVKRPDPEALKKIREERKKAKAENRPPADARTDEQLPQIDDLEITKKLVFNDKRYDAFIADLEELRKLWPAKGSASDEADAEPVVAATPAAATPAK